MRPCSRSDKLIAPHGVELPRFRLCGSKLLVALQQKGADDRDHAEQKHETTPSITTEAQNRPHREIILDLLSGIQRQAEVKTRNDEWTRLPRRSPKPTRTRAAPQDLPELPTCTFHASFAAGSRWRAGLMPMFEFA